MMRPNYFVLSHDLCPYAVTVIYDYHNLANIDIKMVLDILGDETTNRTFIGELRQFAIDYHYVELVNFAVEKEMQFIESEGSSTDLYIVHILNAMQSRRWSDADMCAVVVNKHIKSIEGLKHATDKSLSIILPYLSIDMRKSTYDWVVVVQKDYVTMYRNSVEKLIALGFANENLFYDTIKARCFHLTNALLPELSEISGEKVRAIIQTGDSKLVRFCFEDENAYELLLELAKNEPALFSTEDAALCGLMEVELSSDIVMSESFRAAIVPIIDRCYADMKCIDFYMPSESPEHVQIIKKNALLVYFAAISAEVRVKCGIRPASAVKVWYKYEAEGRWSERS